jgi:hypothetical protein
MNITFTIKVCASLYYYKIWIKIQQNPIFFWKKILKQQVKFVVYPKKNLCDAPPNSLIDLIVNQRWKHGRAMGKHRLTRFMMARTWGSHHLPPFNIFCAWPHGLHPNVILFWDSQVGNLKIPEIGTPLTLEAHNFFHKPLIMVRLKEKL